MKYFDKAVYENAKRVSLDVAEYVNVLMNHGVVGFEKQTMFYAVRHFLTDWVYFDDNGTNLIWHVDLDKGLKQLFKK